MLPGRNGWLPLRSLRKRICGRVLILASLLLISETVGSVRAEPERPYAQASRRPGGSGENAAGPPIPLESGNQIDRTLARGETHSYLIALTSGQYFRVMVDQQGVDVVVTLLGPDGKRLVEVDTPGGTQRPERVSFISETSGVYFLEIRAARKDAGGPYAVRVEEQHEATAQDSHRIAAEKALADGDRLADLATAVGLRQAIEKYQLALSLWSESNDLDGEGEAQIGLGAAYGVLGDNQKALDHFGRALTVMHAAHLPRGEAEALNGLGEIYSSLGEQRRALDYYAEAASRWRSTGYRAGLALTLNNMGLIYDSWGEKQKALQCYREALPLWKGLEDPRGEALTLTSIGKVEDDLGESQRALDAYEQSLSLIRAYGDPVGEAAILNNIGLAYDALGETAVALRYFHEALPLRKKIGSPRGEATTLTCIGKAYYDLGEREKAMENYTRALSLSRAANDPKGQAIALTRLGSLQESFGDRQKALDLHTQALELRRALGDSTGVAQMLLRIGAIQRSLGESEKALAGFREALSLSRSVADPILEVEALWRLAEAKRSQGGLSEARQLIEDAIHIVESVRTKVGSYELRASFLASQRQAFEFYTDLMMRLHWGSPAQGLDALALAATERARARSLLELLVEAHAGLRRGADPALLERERSLQQVLGAKVERQTRLLAAKHGEEQAAEAAKEIEVLTTDYDQVQAQIRATSPRYAALTQSEPPTLSEIQRQLLDDDTLLLEYALGEERSFLWAVTRTEISSFVLPKRSEIDSAARSVYERIRVPPVGHTDTQKYWEDSAHLSEMVLKPVAGLLGKKRLVIVSEGALQFVPFAALSLPAAGGAERGPGPLVANHEIVSLPSASTLAVLRQGLAGRKPAAKALAVIADPVFEKDDVRLGGRAQKIRPATVEAAVTGESVGLERDLLRSVRDVGMAAGAHRISRLPFTRHEAKAILSLVGPSDRKEALDFEASRATAMSAELSQYRFVHFATHGLLNSVHPELSGVVLSLVDREAREQDGFLPAFEVFNLNLPAELVVLSACRTALGKEVRGEGLVGLTRAFMYAGAARVVASLWTVDDLATAELMKRFYGEMLGPGRLAPAAALRAAQIALWKQERWAHPYYWGAFVLQGEWK